MFFPLHAIFAGQYSSIVYVVLFVSVEHRNPVHTKELIGGKWKDVLLDH